MKFPKLRTIGTTLGLASLLVGGSACSKRGQETNTPDEGGGEYNHKAHILKDARKDLKKAIIPESKKQAQTLKTEAHLPQNTVTDVKPQSLQTISPPKGQGTKVVKKRTTPPPLPAVAKKSVSKQVTTPFIHPTDKVKEEIKNKGKDKNEEVTELELCEVEFIDEIKPLEGLTKVNGKAEDDEEAKILGAAVLNNGGPSEGNTPESEKLILGIKILELNRQQIRDLIISFGFLVGAAYLIRRAVKELKGQKAAWLTVPLSLATPGMVKTNALQTAEGPKTASRKIVDSNKTDLNRDEISEAGEGAIIFDTKETEEVGQWIDMGYEDRLKRIQREVEARRGVQTGETTFAPLRPEMFEQREGAENKTTKSHPKANDLRDTPEETVLNSIEANRSQDKGELTETERIVDQVMRGRLVNDIPTPEPIIQKPFSEPPIALGESEEEARESGARWRTIKGEWDEIEADFDATKNDEGDLILEAKDGNKTNHKPDPTKGEILEAKSKDNETNSSPHDPFAGWHAGESTLPLGTTKMAQMFMDIDKSQGDRVDHKGHERMLEDNDAEVESSGKNNPDLPPENSQELAQTGESTLPLNNTDAFAFFRNVDRLQAEPDDEANKDEIPNEDDIFDVINARANIDLHIPSEIREEGWHGLGSMPPINSPHEVKDNKTASGENSDEWKADWEKIIGDTTPPPLLKASIFEIAGYKLEARQSKVATPPTKWGALGRNNNKDDGWESILTDVEPPSGPIGKADTHNSSIPSGTNSSTNNNEDQTDNENDWSDV